MCLGLDVVYLTNITWVVCSGAKPAGEDAGGEAGGEPESDDQAAAVAAAVEAAGIDTAEDDLEREVAKLTQAFRQVLSTTLHLGRMFNLK